MHSENNENLPRRAAVLIPIVREKDGPAILLEVRSMNVWQPGEVCFPGGHIEEGESGVEAAIRETYEELGIPASSVRVRKEMEPERHIRDMLVYPVLADIDPFEPDSLKLRKEEVAGVFTLPLAWLMAHPPTVFEIGGPADEDLPLKLRQYLKNYENRKKRTTFYWEYGPYGIWGFTARLLVRIREMLREETDV
ncbi:MAG: CoA pyrophosphatase [Lachnospiraceae bacterium]|nr:CoA pyrophosphatase [Lachnospiraceae bacterium]